MTGEAVLQNYRARARLPRQSHRAVSQPAGWSGGVRAARNGGGCASGGADRPGADPCAAALRAPNWKM